MAIFLTTTGIMALLALQPQGWKTMAKSDYLGRASGILYERLSYYENLILNSCYDPTPILGESNYSILVSGQNSAVSGDITYTVDKIVTKISADGVKPRTYCVTVTVTWPTNSTGIKESLIIATQSMYDYPQGCTEVPP